MVTEADELIENGDESEARRLLIAELAAIRLLSRRARQAAPGARSSGPRQGARGSSKWLAGDVFAWLISTIDSMGVLFGTEVDLVDGDTVGSDLAIHFCGNGDDVCCERVKTSDASGYLSNKLRHLRQFLPDTLVSVEKGDATPRGCRSCLRPGVTDDCEADRLLEKLVWLSRWLKRMMSERCGWTPTVTGIVGSRSEMQSLRAAPPPFQLGI